MRCAPWASRCGDIPTFKPQPADQASLAAADPRQLYGAFADNRIAYFAGLIEADDRKRAEELRSYNAGIEARHREMLAANSFCQWAPGGPPIAVKTMDHILANCPIYTTDYFNYAASIGANPELLTKARYEYDKRAGRYDKPIPNASPYVATSPNWEAWGNAITQSARDSSDGFIRESRRNYYENLERWNTGKQKSCC